MAANNKTLKVNDPPMKFVGLWSDEKTFGPEGSELLVLNSAYAPVLTQERWVMHNNMWTFVPTENGIL